MKAALVTGGSTGIGKGIALELAANGFNLAITHLNEAESALEVSEIITQKYGRKCIIIQGDLADSATPGYYWDEALRAYGEIHLVVNNAGMMLFGKIADMDSHEMQKLIQVNFLTTIALTQKAAIHMMGQGIAGSIINISSSRSQRAYPTDAIYGGMKAAMMRATESMALEFAPYGIRINCVAPGAIATEKVSADRMEKLGSRIPVGRMGTPQDIGHAVVWLSSDKASYITGITLRVDGGLILPGMPENTDAAAGNGWGQLTQ